MYKDVWFCRWCGKVYKTHLEPARDGFCCPACKQAHYRAYKKYVTGLDRYRASSAPRGVTQKKKKSKKK